MKNDTPSTPEDSILMVDLPPTLTTADLADFLKEKPQSQRKRRMNATGPAYNRLGNSRTGRVIYRREAVLEWLKEREFKSTAEEAAIASARPRTLPAMPNPTGRKGRG